MIVKELIDEFLSTERNVSDYRQAVQLLKRSGFIELVRKLGHPNVISNGSDLNAMAHEGSWSNGFQTSMNHLEFFERLYSTKTSEGKALIAPSFGAAKIAKQEGYLSEKEIEQVIKKGDKK